MFKAVPRDKTFTVPSTPEIGKYSPNYDLNKFVQSFYFDKSSSQTPHNSSKIQKKNSLVCNRLVRSLQNRKARMEIINKIFRKQRGNKIYRFGEKLLKSKIKQLANQGDIKGEVIIISHFMRLGLHHLTKYL